MSPRDRDRDSDIGYSDTERGNLIDLSEERDRPEEGETSYDVAVRVHRVAAEFRIRLDEYRRATNDFFKGVFDRQDKHERKLDQRLDKLEVSFKNRFDSIDAKLNEQRRIGWVIALALVAIALMMFTRGNG